MSDWVLEMRLRLAGDPVQMREPLLAAAGDPCSLLNGWEDMSASVVSQSKCDIEFKLAQCGMPETAIAHSARLARQFSSTKVTLYWLAVEQCTVGRVMFRHGQQQLNELFAVTRKFRRMTKAWFQVDLSPSVQS